MEQKAKGACKKSLSVVILHPQTGHAAKRRDPGAENIDKDATG